MSQNTKIIGCYYTNFERDQRSPFNIDTFSKNNYAI